ncbi:MAG: hypothetical protein FWC94_04690 [Bacteroidales bacterium]|nr:hypothetical protein [Bacteroidales bacterium]
MENKLQLFEKQQVRSIWDEEQEKWWFSVLDIIAILTDQPDYKKTRNYWKWLKNKLKDEGSNVFSNTNEVVSDTNHLKNELGTICPQLKMPAPDGKMRLTDVADTEQILRLIQSIPSKKAEPFKMWLARVGRERLDQLQDPELSIEQAMLDYKRLGYSDSWINQRLKSIEIRKDLTDEWKKHGLKEGAQFATLTDIITKTWSGKTTKEYKQFKGLKKENLRDNMTNKELVLSMLAELSTKEISETTDPETMEDHQKVARQGGEIAKNARLELEQKTGKKVVSPLNAKQSLLLNQEHPGKPK